MKGPILVINVCIVLMLMTYVYKLENERCVCSRDWRRDFIKYYTTAVVFRIVFFNVLVNSKNPLLRLVFDTITFLINIFGFVYLWALFTYSKKLKKEKCACSDSVALDIMSTYSTLVLGVNLLLLVLYFYTLISQCL
jgi:hypothetical protein